MSYLIQFRFSGYSKNVIKELISVISRNFRVRRLARKKTMPHITLAGPLLTRDENRLIRDVENVAKKFDLVEFNIDGFGKFNERAIFVNIKSSDNLDKLRNKLVKKLDKFCKLKPHDYEKEYRPHATLILNTDIVGKSGKSVSQKFSEIIKFLKSWTVPKLTMHVLRITIIKDSRILCEYNLMLGKVLSRREALNRDIYSATVGKIQRKATEHAVCSKMF